MSALKVRAVTITSGIAQVYDGPGLLVAAVFDHNASSSGNVVTLYDGNSTGGIQVYTRTSDTDAGTTVPIQLFTDGDVVAGTSTADAKSGIPFSRGLCISKTGDTTHQDVYTFIIKPLIRKSVNLRAPGGAVSVFNGPGILHALRIKSDAAVASGADLYVKDSPIAGSGNTLLTKTNYGAATEAIRPVVTTTGSDEAGTAKTTAATGAYASPGICFVSGLNVQLAEAGSGDEAYDIDLLIEA